MVDYHFLSPSQSILTRTPGSKSDLGITVGSPSLRIVFLWLLTCISMVILSLSFLLLTVNIVAAQEQSPLYSYSNNTKISLPPTSVSSYPEMFPPDIFDKVKASVVDISASSSTLGNASSYGSGFVYDKYGHILTNDHVVKTGSSVVITFIDGNQYNASVIGRDPINDIAVVKIVENLTEPLQPVEFGNSSNVRIGERVFAIGNPYGLADTMTGGFISQIGRLLPEVGNVFPLPNMIQTDAVINPGNSGGPLLNVQGLVVGMNTATINSQLGGSTGLGFAIPSKTLLREVPTLIKNGKYPHPWLGLSARTLTAQLDEAARLRSPSCC
jgi:S1-C subfamily serine protease